MDLDNRLVADEVERRWNQALSRVREVEAQVAAQTRVNTIAWPYRASRSVSDLAAALEGIWSNAETNGD